MSVNPHIITTTAPEAKMREKGQNDETDEMVEALALSNPVVLDRILFHFRKDGGRLRDLRLVSQSFNEAILTLPFPTPIVLNLNLTFPQKKSKWRLWGAPKKKSKVLVLTSRLARSVTIQFPVHKNSQREVMKALLAFLRVHGEFIQDMTLKTVHAEGLKSLIPALSLYCPNLLQLSLHMQNWRNGCPCSSNQIRQEEEFLQSSATTLFFPSLSSLQILNCPHHLKKETTLCSKALVEAAPNLSNVFVAWTDPSMDLGSHKALSTLYFVGVYDEDLQKTLVSCARAVERLHIICVGDEEPRQVGSLLSLPPLPRLSYLHIRLEEVALINFANFILPAIFAEETRLLTFLRIDSAFPMEPFMTSLRGRNGSKESVKKLQIGYSVDAHDEDEVEEGGVLELRQVPYLHEAFPNLTSLSLFGVKEGNLQTLLNMASRWRSLRELSVGANFPIPLSDLRRNLEGFWRGDNNRLRRLAIGLGNRDFDNPMDRHPTELGPYTDWLMMLHGLKDVQMEEVRFVNFQMSPALAADLRRFIAAEGLPVTLTEIKGQEPLTPANQNPSNSSFIQRFMEWIPFRAIEYVLLVTIAVAKVLTSIFPEEGTHPMCRVQNLSDFNL